MDARAFLEEEFRSVTSALNETLRHDYGPDHSKAYFQECRERIEAIGQELTDNPDMDRAAIAALMQSLSAIGSRISLIERSHLGEFSWPFADVVRRITDALFVEKTVRGPKTPIIHVVAEGMDYRIVDDDLSTGGIRRIIIVAFPRQLKYHVLIHAIFGHELGHTAHTAEKSGAVMHREVMPALRRGTLMDETQAVAWLDRADAPPSIQQASPETKAASFDEQSIINWREEIVSDLFGLILFGPPFVAAHRAVIEALCPHPTAMPLNNSTHPPYPVRQRLLARALRKLEWDRPVCSEKHPIHRAAEETLLSYVTECVDDPWFDLIDDDQLDEVLAGLKKIFESHEELAYSPPDEACVVELMDRLALERPPLFDEVDAEGKPDNKAVKVSACLYAGWSYWFGRDQLMKKARGIDPDVQVLSFLELNRLCSQAMLQQEAVALVASLKPAA